MRTTRTTRTMRTTSAARTTRSPAILACLAAATLLAASACGDSGPSTVITDRELPDNPDPPPSTFAAIDHVTDADYDQLVVEVDFVTERGPDDTALTDVQAALDRMVADGHLAKSAGASFALDDTIAAGDPDKVWTFAELSAMSAAYRDRDLPADASSIHVLYVDGHYEGDTAQGSVLGFAWGGSWIVMLKDNITRACSNSSVLQGPLLGGLRERVCARAEASVLLHELGHIFGLVNNGVPMVEDHEDPDHAKHDVDPDCLMYWAIERSGAVDIVAQRFIGGGEPTLGFCDASLADLAAAIAEARR